MTPTPAQELCRAAERGDLEAVRALLAAGASVDPVPAGEDSPLCLAVMFRQLAVAEALLDAGANVNHRGGYGRTPLLYAAGRSVALIRLLVARGADLRARHDGDDDAMDELIAANDGDPACAEALIELGFDLSMRPTKWYAGRTHLMQACFCGRVELVDVLLRAGADPNEGDVLSKVFACIRQKQVPALLRRLADSSLDPNADGGYGGSLLAALCRLGDVERVEALLKRGADPKGRGGQTPLAAAAESGKPEVRELLLRYGALPAKRERPPERKAELERLEAAARATPGDGAARLEWAEALLAEGCRAAAAVELAAAARHGAAIPDGLHAGLRFENPAGVAWTILPRAGDDVAGLVDDGRFPGARVASAERELPLAFVLGPFCTRCDEKGETECSDCGGTGTRPGFTDPDAEYPCDPRQTCARCGGTKYVLDSAHAGKGACRHEKLEVEAEGPGYVLSRCPACGLPATTCGGLWSREFACGECGRFVCTCVRA